MKMTRAYLMRLATGLGTGFMCQCELPDAEYFAQKWEEPRVVFETPKWQLAQMAVEEQKQVKPAASSTPNVLPDLPALEPEGWLSSSVTETQMGSLLPALSARMVENGTVNEEGIDDKPSAKASAPPPPLAMKPSANLTDKKRKSVGPSKSDVALKAKAPPAKEAINPVGSAPKAASSKQKIQSLVTAPGFTVTKPPTVTSLIETLTIGLAEKSSPTVTESGGAVSEPKAGTSEGKGNTSQ
jgi:hypothetical protein